MDFPSKKPLSKEEIEKRLEELRDKYKGASETDRKVLEKRAKLLKIALTFKPLV